MMPDFYAVFDIFESDDSASRFLTGFSRREDVLEYLRNTLAQRGIEIFEDKMRVRLADGTACGIRDISSQNDVAEREGRGGTVR